MNRFRVASDDGSQTQTRWFAALALTVFTFATRAWIFGDPVVNMDEQFYFLVGDRILQGEWPYIEIWDRKPIGLFLIYSIAHWAFPSAVVGYQLLAAVAVTLTSWVIYSIARHPTGHYAALAGAAAYPAWLTVFGGIAGQSPAYYNLPMAAAAALTLSAILSPSARNLTARGILIMLLTGIAMQIKYTAVFEGIFFGLSLLWVSHKAGRRLARMGLDAIAWAFFALVPTLVALCAYAVAGHAGEFIQANFLSVLVDQNPTAPALGRLAGLLLGLSPLGVCGWIAWRRRSDRSAEAHRPALWLFAWVAASLFGFLLFGVWNDHYVLPLLPPLCVVAALGFDSLTDRRKIAVAAVLGLGLVGGFARSAVDVAINGNERQAARLAALVQPYLGDRCLYVNEDLSLLYYLTESCLPTRYVFPQHLALSRYESGLGVDQMGELRRVLGRRPDVVVLSTEPDSETRWATRRLVLTTLKSGYRYVGAAQVGLIDYAVFARNDRVRPGPQSAP